MSVSVHMTSTDRKAESVAYLVDDTNDKRWATIKVLGKGAVHERITLFVSEFTAREIYTALGAVIAEFDAQVATETDTETETE